VPARHGGLLQFFTSPQVPSVKFTTSFAKRPVQFRADRGCRRAEGFSQFINSLPARPQFKTNPRSDREVFSQFWDVGDLSPGVHRGVGLRAASEAKTVQDEEINLVGVAKPAEFGTALVNWNIQVCKKESSVMRRGGSCTVPFAAGEPARGLSPCGTSALTRSPLARSIDT